MLFSCVKSRNFDALPKDCTSNLVANATYSEVKNLYVDQTFQIQQDLIIEGYVISSDQAGNFFSAIYFQNRSTEPTEGFQIEIDLRDAHLFYPVGSKIYIKLKGLYLGKSKDVFKIGGVFTSFGNESVGRLPSTVVDQHIFAACDSQTGLVPTIISLENIPNNLTNTLVQINSVELSENDLGKPFAVEREETPRLLLDCSDNEMIMLNSGFSDFQNQILPEGNGSITGVLLRENDKFQLAVRSLEDINLEDERCVDIIDEFTSDNLLISEVADPDNNLGARFVELYNASDSSLSLKGWTLQRYTNANTEVSATADLSGYTIDALSTFVISPNAEEFELVYGFPPDLSLGKNSPADSNGDDNLQLIDPFGKVIDSFGIIGEDGTGTNHEFEDGRVLRKPSIETANPTYNPNEWTIYNDTGAAGTVNQPQNAPEDFTPGERD